jgi:hypothetical protein
MRIPLQNDKELSIICRYLKSNFPKEVTEILNAKFAMIENNKIGRIDFVDRICKKMSSILLCEFVKSY